MAPFVSASLRLRPVILLLGDSLTEEAFGVDGAVGWASLLASAYKRRVDPINRGFSGYNTRHFLQTLPRIFGEEGSGEKSSPNVLFCTILLGTNDMALPGEYEHIQHVPIDEYKDNLTKIISFVRERLSSGNVDTPIILMTPPPVNEPAWADWLEEDTTDRTNKDAKVYGQCAKQVASETGCDVLDLFDLLGGDGDVKDYKECLSDGVHLSGVGNRLLAEGLLKLIKSKYPHLAPMEGDGKHEDAGMPMEEELWTDLC